MDRYQLTRREFRSEQTFGKTEPVIADQIQAKVDAMFNENPEKLTFTEDFQAVTTKIMKTIDPEGLDDNQKKAMGIGARFIKALSMNLIIPISKKNPFDGKVARGDNADRIRLTGDEVKKLLDLILCVMRRIENGDDTFTS